LKNDPVDFSLKAGASMCRDTFFLNYEARFRKVIKSLINIYNMSVQND